MKKLNQTSNKLYSRLFALSTFIFTLLLTTPVFAAGGAQTDPVEAVKNFGDKLGTLISAAGGIALLVGVVVIALGIASHDPSQKMTGGVVAAAGALLAFAPQVVKWFTVASFSLIDVTSAVEQVSNLLIL